MQACSSRAGIVTTQHQARVELVSFKKRVRKLRLDLTKAGFEGSDRFLVSAGSNIQYLCGFAGSYGFLIISAARTKLYTDGRYTAQARAQARGVDVCESTQSPLDLLFSDLQEEQVRRLAVEENRISHALYLTLRRKLRRTRVEPVEGLVEKLRLVKTPDEIEKNSARCATEFKSVRQRLLTGRGRNGPKPAWRPNWTSSSAAWAQRVRRLKRSSPADLTPPCPMPAPGRSVSFPTHSLFWITVLYSMATTVT